MKELVRHPVASTIIAYYMLNNIGDKVGFIDDTNEEQLVCGQKYNYRFFSEFREVTDTVIVNLIQEGVIRDKGIIKVFEDEDLFLRDLEVIL